MEFSLYVTDFKGKPLLAERKIDQETAGKKIWNFKITIFCLDLHVVYLTKLKNCKNCYESLPKEWKRNGTNGMIKIDVVFQIALNN